jgi:hypothetical protein
MRDSKKIIVERLAKGVGVVKGDAVVVEMESFSFKIPELRQAPARVEAQLFHGLPGTFVCAPQLRSLVRPPYRISLVNSLGRCF